MMIQQQPSADDRDARSIFVKNVHFAADQSEIIAEFESAGPVKAVTILKDKITRQSKG